jgi:hypothetical protein
MEGMRALAIVVLLGSLHVAAGCVMDPQGAGSAPQFRSSHRGPPGGDGRSQGGLAARGQTPWLNIATRGPTSESGSMQPQLAPPRQRLRSGFQVRYEHGGALDEVRIALQREGIFDRVVAQLNRRVRMRGAVLVHLGRCGTANAFYEPRTSRIIVCYEFVAQIARSLVGNVRGERQLHAAVTGTTLFAFFHELGHALRHQLNLAVVGREEDAVDQLATLVLLSAGEVGLHAALTTANWFVVGGRSSGRRSMHLAYWDDHSLDQQRFYGIICLIYGSDPERHSALGASLSQRSRSARCREHYVQISTAWNRLLAPHVRGPVTALLAGMAAEERPPKPVTDVSCQRVAERLADLSGDSQRGRLANLTTSERRAAERTLESELLLSRLGFIDRCHDERWNRRRRLCVLRSNTVERALRCR